MMGRFSVQSHRIIKAAIISLTVALLAGCAPMGKDGMVDGERIRRGFEAAFNDGDIAQLDTILDPDYTEYKPGGKNTKGLKVYKQHILEVRKIFPDLHLTIDEVVIEGDKVAMRGVIRGTQKEQFRNIPATGKTIELTTMNFSRVRNGRIFEAYVLEDDLGLMQQLGVIPVGK